MRGDSEDDTGDDVPSLNRFLARFQRKPPEEGPETKSGANESGHQIPDDPHGSRDSRAGISSGRRAKLSRL